MTNPTSNFGWQMPEPTDLVTNLPADFEVFGQAVDTDFADLLGGTTGQVLSKTSGTDLDFTWTTPTDQTPLTTKGDLFTFSTTDARLPVGTNTYLLTADSAEATGLKWSAPAGNALVGCQAYVTSGSQTAYDSSDTIVNLGSELFDTNGFHDTSTNTSRFTIPSGKAGKYNLTTTIYVGSAISYRAISVLVNGSLLTAYGLSGGQFNVYNDNGTIASGSVVLSLSVADYVQVAIQVYGGNRTISSANVSLIYLGA
jgi:hypothetical protein